MRHLADTGKSMNKTSKYDSVACCLSLCLTPGKLEQAFFS